MLKIIKRTVPLETEGTINRLSMELAEARGETPAEPFVVSKTYQAGEYIVHGGKVFVTSTVIIQGEKLIPGQNATETSIESIINILQKEE